MGAGMPSNVTLVPAAQLSKYPASPGATAFSAAGPRSVPYSARMAPGDTARPWPLAVLTTPFANSAGLGAGETGAAKLPYKVNGCVTANSHGLPQLETTEAVTLAARSVLNRPFCQLTKRLPAAGAAMSFTVEPSS